MGYITCNQTPQLVGICKGRKGAVYEADDLAEMDVGGSAPQTIAALLTFPPLSKARHSNWENRVGGSGELGRTQMLPVLFSPTDVVCAAPLLGKEKPTNSSETANTNFSAFISATH
jgi:hypothetical protein